MAVGYHAVEKGQLTGGEVPIVIGCGPVGLAVIAALKLKGIGPIIASDFSPVRRAMAEQMGADVTLNPADQNSALCSATEFDSSPDSGSIDGTCTEKNDRPDKSGAKIVCR